jgi:hypothetical protein
MPTSGSNQQTTGVLGACGSQGSNNMLVQGPNCVFITDPSDLNVHLSGMQAMNLPVGFSLAPIRYPKSNSSDWNEAKTQQSNDIIALAKFYGSVILFCYSAGVDSCLFASDSLSNLDTIVLIGGPYGGYDGSQNNFVSSNDLVKQMENLSEEGTNILIVDDAAVWSDSYKPAVANGKFQIINAPTHYIAGDSTDFFQEIITNWIPNPDFFFPSDFFYP